MSFIRIVGFAALAQGLRMAANVGGPPIISRALEKEAEEVKDKIQENIIRQGLVESGHLYDSVQIIAEPHLVGVIVMAEYGITHEFGASREATGKQIKFFWAKYYETGDKMWKCMALSGHYTIPARPFVRPAADEHRVELWQSFGNNILGELLAVF